MLHGLNNNNNNNNTRTMFMVLSSWQSHCESSPAHLTNVGQRQAAADPQRLRPSQHSCRAVSSSPVSCRPYINHHHLLLLSPKADTHFYRPTYGVRLSQPKHTVCEKLAWLYVAATWPGVEPRFYETLVRLSNMQLRHHATLKLSYNYAHTDFPLFR